MAGYKHLCRFCNKLIPGDSNLCPICGRRSPFMARCPRCKALIQKDYKVCTYCGLPLEIICPKCGEITFLDEYCENCGASLRITCKNPRCKTEQVVGSICINCGKPLK